MHILATRRVGLFTVVAFAITIGFGNGAAAETPGGLRVGAAAVELQGDDSMVIAGSILPRYSKGQEGMLRACAVVVQGPRSTKLAIVACDVLMLERDILDAASKEIERRCGIPFGNILINATHTHHAPSTCTVHGYERNEVFCGRVQKAIVEAVQRANDRLKSVGNVSMFFRLGEESSVGQNSRLLLSDGTILWSGSRDDAVRPTGPFDPELPVIVFRRKDQSLEALLFNHSTHTMGSRKPGVRSPAFYGLAAQELEQQYGGTVVFLEGASGSTHNLTVRPAEAVIRIKNAVSEALGQAKPVRVDRVASLKREITVHVRHFDERKDDEAVRSYCTKRLSRNPEKVIEVFRAMRRKLASRQGEAQKTWVQALVIGDVALVGVPCEFFTKLGIEIKRRSPYRYTYVAELANDWVGYIPDKHAYDLGGYQVWTGLHSYLERGTGEKMVDVAVDLLRELHDSR